MTNDLLSHCCLIKPNDNKQFFSVITLRRGINKEISQLSYNRLTASFAFLSIITTVIIIIAIHITFH